MTEPPALPARLTDPMGTVAVLSALWSLGVVVLFLGYLIAGRPLDIWFTTCVTGCVLGLVGTAIFRWQRKAARRGSRGAQEGLD